MLIETCACSAWYLFRLIIYVIPVLLWISIVFYLDTVSKLHMFYYRKVRYMCYFSVGDNSFWSSSQESLCQTGTNLDTILYGWSSVIIVSRDLTWHPKLLPTLLVDWKLKIFFLRATWWNETKFGPDSTVVFPSKIVFIEPIH